MANEYLTVQQAQYLLTKTNAEIAALRSDPVDASGSESVPTNSTTAVSHTAQYGPGVYLLSGFASFPASATGRRRIYIATTSDGSAIDDWSQITVAPSPTQPTIIQVTTVVKITANTTWYLRAYHNSGSTMTVTGGIRVSKLH